MKYRIIAAACAVLMAAGTLTGCGDSGKTAETESSSSASGEVASEEEAEAAGFSDGTDEEGNVSGETVLDTSKELTGLHHAEINIEDYGTIDMELDADTAPITVTNFVKLAQDGFYDGLTFWRIKHGFMIQGGCPNETGTGGPGYSIKGEFTSNGFKNDLKHTEGVLSMARAMHPDSAGSQFFIMHKTSPHLDGQYAAFGKVIEGMDVVNDIANVPTDFSDRPVMDVVIKTVTVDTDGVEYPEPETM